MRHLAAAGCRDFFVATWAEAATLAPLPEGISLSVLHGVGASDMVAARTLPARPVLGSLEQVARRSEEHTSELQSLMRNSYAVFCLKTHNKLTPTQMQHTQQINTTHITIHN